MTLLRSIAFVSLIMCAPGYAPRAHAHFPWLATDPQGFAHMHFGESPYDQNYRLPDAVQNFAVNHDGFDKNQDQLIPWKTIEEDQFLGLRSTEAIGRLGRLSGACVHGLYHGAKLVYYVQHCADDDPDAWPRKNREKLAWQVLLQRDQSKLRVTVLHDGKPEPLANI
ncbi:MAG: hypothetical protein KDA61_00525, partial [Planctomycetales bacterium]|nr:hypothetical protein [Planctomycetales bacterium]